MRASRGARLMKWLDDRLPVTATFERHMSKYPAPSKLNFWYFFGGFALVVVVIQFLSGIWLLMNYNSDSTSGAFSSIEYIMRDVEYGWLLRYMHSTGATALFLVVYLHMFRALLYGSYRKPRELVWLIGVTLYLALMIEGFLGYVLPWGQMSYWGAQVIVSLFGAVPVIGEELVVWFRGDYLISGITLTRFAALHVAAVPLVLIMLVFVHILALHEVGVGNPEGVDIKKNLDEDGVPVDSTPFHPYKTISNILAVGVFLFFFCLIMFFFPEGGGYMLEYANFEQADPLKTPEHIAPVWYFTPFYAMLRAVTFPLFGIDAKFWGLVVMASAILFLFLVPWLDRSKVDSIRYRSWPSRVFLGLFAVSFIILGYLGLQPVTELYGLLTKICTVVYFMYFLLMPVYTSLEKTRPVPERLLR